MKRVISFFLCAIMLMSSTYTALATETTDISYNTLSVEFSDNLGMTEELNVMMTDDHLYVDAEQLGDRLGYQAEVGNEYVAIYNKNFSNTVPYGLTTFYYDSTKVRHMLFNKMVDYEAPFKIVKNSDGVWIPFEFSLLLLNSSDVVLDNQVHIEMPQKNIVDIYMDVLKIMIDIYLIGKAMPVLQKVQYLPWGQEHILFRYLVVFWIKMERRGLN